MLFLRSVQDILRSLLQLNLPSPSLQGCQNYSSLNYELYMLTKSSFSSQRFIRLWMFKVVVFLRHAGQQIRNFASKGPTPQATLIFYAHQRHNSCSQMSYTTAPPSLWQFKQTELIIIMYNAIHHHSDAEVRTKTAPKTTKATSARLVVASEGRRLGSSELVEAEEVLRRRLGTVLLGVVEGIHWVVPCSRRDLRGSREGWHILVRISRLIEDDAIWAHILLSAEGVVEVVRRIYQVLWRVTAQGEGLVICSLDGSIHLASASVSFKVDRPGLSLLRLLQVLLQIEVVVHGILVYGLVDVEHSAVGQRTIDFIKEYFQNIVFGNGSYPQSGAIAVVSVGEEIYAVLGGAPSDRKLKLFDAIYADESIGSVDAVNEHDQLFHWGELLGVAHQHSELTVGLLIFAHNEGRIQIYIIDACQPLQARAQYGYMWQLYFKFCGLVDDRKSSMIRRHSCGQLPERSW